MAEKKKAAKPEQVEAAEVQTAEQEPAGSGWGEKLIWGVLFIVVGAVLLLGNMGILTVELSSLWRLWPVLIIVAGLSVLSLRGWLGGLVYAVAALGVGGLIWAVMVGPLSEQVPASVRDEVNIARADDEVERLSVEVKAGAAALEIGSHSGDGALMGVLESDFAKINHLSSVSDGLQKVSLSLEGNTQWWRGGSHNRLALRLNDELPLDFDIDAGAVSIDADLSDVKLRRLNIDSGASSVDLKLGSLVDESRVTIDTGASSLKIQLPEEVGVRLELKDGLSSKDIPEAYEKIDDKVYHSANYSTATKRIILVIDMGLSSLDIKEY